MRLTPGIMFAYETVTPTQSEALEGVTLKMAPGVARIFQTKLKVTVPSRGGSWPYLQILDPAGKDSQGSNTLAYFILASMVK